MAGVTRFSRAAPITPTEATPIMRQAFRRVVHQISQGDAIFGFGAPFRFPHLSSGVEFCLHVCILLGHDFPCQASA
jgi:hypothetical protein